MARFEFRLPDIGEGIAEAEIVAWHVKVGDTIEEDQQLADLMTDKATVEMESPVAGKILQLAGEVGEQIPIGSILAVIETEGAAAADAPAKAEPVEEEVPLADGAVAPTEAQEENIPVTKVAEQAPPPPSPRVEPEVAEKEPSHGKVLTSPAVRARARDLGIDLSQVKTTGDRVRHSDLDAYLLYNGGTVAARGSTSAPRTDETIKVVGLRRKIAENMAEANRRIQHFTLVEEFDVTALEEARQIMNRDRGNNPKLTLLPFLITAMSRALADWPMLNATFDDEAMVVTRHGPVHMGMATQTPNGLMVATIRDAQGKSIWELAAEITRLSEAARTGKASREELSGATFTISSLGPMGGITSTPVVNPPQVAIVAVNKIEEKLVPIDDEIEIRKRMNLSLSCDHRVVDGWDAASFMQALKPLIENPLRLLS
ncbi:dihydrolipoamide acetyltransferase family protein [Sphingomonas daechungensis]|uniref:Dihydrolipoamide acetyltransferase component of pyruvate dehydrogenase complex n=1 Tax=Sphingomonas daechungensis TaxID=1176646 RepID=A0ABX6T3A8_9SPHN|nr:dihydrolipoamide acetyltransferase family protein [Sphingomonas daechungensis]QNP43193.1 2-oxo acid dehydrogenase subunit E2 [Sphingomonas daechungensis]